MQQEKKKIKNFCYSLVLIFENIVAKMSLDFPGGTHIAVQLHLLKLVEYL